MPRVDRVPRSLPLSPQEPKRQERSLSLFGRDVPVIVLAGFIAVAVAWIGMVVFAEPWGKSLLPSGMDARCYWVPSLSDPYLHSNWTEQIAYPYSPAFLQVLQPIRLLPWQAFMAVWSAMLLATLVAITGPRLILVGLVWFGLMEAWGGNIELLVGLAILIGFRWPAAWSFVLLTKIAPGVGLLWFAVRREWKSLFVALAATAAVVAISFVLLPDAWFRWPQVLINNVGKGGTWAAVPIPFLVRLPFAVLLIVWGALRNQRWVVPIGSMLALPALWYGGLSIALVALPLSGIRTWGELRQKLAAAVVDARSGITRLRQGRSHDPAAL